MPPISEKAGSRGASISTFPGMLPTIMPGVWASRLAIIQLSTPLIIPLNMKFLYTAPGQIEVDRAQQNEKPYCSNLNASTGFILAAFLAGTIPEITPTSVENTRAKIINCGETTVFIETPGPII
jgi:hypothetical protein